MKYEQKSFSVPALPPKGPEKCEHGWLDPRGRCVLCGDQVLYHLVKTPFDQSRYGVPREYIEFLWREAAVLALCAGCTDRG